MGAHTLASGSHFMRWWTIAVCVALAGVAVLYVVGATTGPPAGGGTPRVGSLPPVRTSPGPPPGGLVTGGPAPVLITGTTTAGPPGTTAAVPVLVDQPVAVSLATAASPVVLAPSTVLSIAEMATQPMTQAAADDSPPAASTAALAVPAVHPSDAPEPAPPPPPESESVIAPASTTAAAPEPTATPTPEPDPSTAGCVRPGRNNPGNQPYKKPLATATPDGHTVCMPQHP